MKSLFISYLTLVLFYAMFLTANISYSQTTVGGNISANTSWTTSGSPYFVGQDVTVLEGITLTIQPGVIVKFKDHYTDIWVNGTINAIGNSSSKIIFTSSKDDAHGGDTNNDGSATSPAANDWGGIVLGNTSTGNHFQYCWFGYGGGWSTSAMLEVRISEAEIRNSTFSYSYGRGIFSEKSALNIQDCNFNNNSQDGIYFDGLHATTPSVLKNNTFLNNTNWAVYGNLFNCTSNVTLSGNTSSGSAHNGFGMYHWINGNVIFTGQSDFPFIITGNDVIIAENAVLEITDKTTVKFDDHYSDLFVYGRIRAMGTVGNEISFTSLKDDSKGGDTNGDGSLTLPAGNDWGGIVLQNTSTSNIFNHCWLGYGGGWSTSAMLEVKESEAEIRESSFCYSSSRGLYLESSAIDIHDSKFIGNASEGIFFNGLSKTTHSSLMNNQFSGNVNWAVFGRLNNCERNIALTGNTSSGSFQNGFGIYNTIGGNVSFNGQLDFPFIVADGDVTITESASLTFSAGTGIKFQTHYCDLSVYGTLTAIGTSDKPIYFTSLKDDVHGGDCNGDADATSPAGNDWGGIIFRDTSTFNRLHYCWIGYGGGWSTDANVLNLSSEVEVRNCTFANANGRGYQGDFSALDIQNSIFKNNTTDGIYYNGLSETVNSVLTNNIFTLNGNWSVIGDLKNCQADILLTGNTASGSTQSGFGIYGHVAGNVLFDGQTDFPFIVTGSDLTIDKSGILTFSSGTTVKFVDYYSDIWVNGSMIAQGTETSPISFTSLKDDIHGGDTNSDGNVSQAKSDDWSGIIYDAESKNNVLEHCWIGYGGGWSTYANVHIYCDGLILRNCTFANSSDCGVYSEYVGLKVYDCVFSGNANNGLYYKGLDGNTPTIFQNNQFIDNSVWAVNGDLQESTSDITLSGNTSIGSNHNGFGLKGHITAGKNHTFGGQTNFPLIFGPDVTVTGKLTITPGTTIKFDDYYSDLLIYGTLDAQGTTANPIIFTSLKDDVHGGDTNGDASVTEPAPDNWGSIWFYDISSNNKLINTWIGYGGGYSSSAMVTALTSGLEIDYSNIIKSSDKGIHIEGSNPHIKHTVFSGNITGIYTTAKSLPELKYNQIVDNTNYGVYNADGSVDVDAKNNWWGSATGPYHPTLNANGLGNKVSDHVLFDPWNITTTVKEIKSENGLVLGQFYPNPASGQVTIPYDLDNYGRVLLQVINVEGKIIHTILDQDKPSGTHKVIFNTVGLKSGTYFLRLISNDLSKISRMIVVN